MGGGNGSISNAITTGTGGLIMSGTGAIVWTLTGANTFTGATTINSGTLAIGAGGTLAASSGLTLANGATFDTSAAGAQIIKISQCLGQHGQWQYGESRRQQPDGGYDEFDHV